MNNLMIKSLKFFFFGITPFFLIASGSNVDTKNIDIECGEYNFEISGLVDYKSIGEAFFRTILEEDVLGNHDKSYGLSFKSEANLETELIEFIISPNSIGVDGILSGTYKIKNINQLIHHFDGVYGFADLKGFSELPFFVSKGSITIDDNFNEGIAGSLNVILENANNESLHIKGFFNAN